MPQCSPIILAKCVDGKITFHGVLNHVLGINTTDHLNVHPSFLKHHVSILTVLVVTLHDLEPMIYQHISHMMISLGEEIPVASFFHMIHFGSKEPTSCQIELDSFTTFQIIQNLESIHSNLVQIR